MATGVGGRRLIVGLYVGIVCFTGVAGYLTAGVVGEIEPPRFLFVIPFPATQFGLAAYGALTIALMLGVLLLAVTVVADRVDDATPGRETPATADGDDPAGETTEDDSTSQ